MSQDHIAEEGRRLASQREDLIAQGIDPGELLVPIHPADAERQVEPCPDCARPEFHAEGCRRIMPAGDPLEHLQFGPPWHPWPTDSASDDKSED
jgi:hypothetical protein